MSRAFSFDAPSPLPLEEASPRAEFILVQRALCRVLAFVGHDIDDVLNDPIVRNKVVGYYKLHKWVQRNCEIVELEKQWNSLMGDD
jgi:hypothetical protein